jgi:hypothetical protein
MASVHKAYLDRFVIGAGLSKDSCSHHDGNYAYYRVEPGNLEELWRRTFVAMEQAAPLTMSEHSNPRRCRLFMDFDSNKDPQGPKLSEDGFLALLRALQNAVGKSFLMNEADVMEQILGHPQSSPTFAWVKEPQRDLFDEEDGRDPYGELMTRVDPTIVIVSKRPTEPGLFAYHLVWPFILTSHRKAREFFAQFFRSSDEGREWEVKAKPDHGVLQRGALRGIYNAKKGAGPDTSPGDLLFYDCDMILSHNCDNLLLNSDFRADILGSSVRGVGRDDLCIKMIKATSLLMGFDWDGPKRKKPTPDRPPSMGPSFSHVSPALQNTPPPQSEDLSAQRQHFMRVCEDLNPHAVIAELQGLCERYDGQVDNPFEAVKEGITRYLNRFLAVITSCSKPCYLVKECPLSTSGELFPMFLHRDWSDLKMYLDPCSIWHKFEGKKKAQKLEAAILWKESPHRLTFKTITMCDPKDCPPDVFNLWRGPRIPPELARAYREKSVLGLKTHKVISTQTILDHIYTVFCSEDTEYYTYMINWLAHLVQRPLTRTNSCIILQSQEGVGKDIILARTMKAILGENHVLITARADDLGGKFNYSLEGKILAVFDEASSIEDSHSNVLKSLITDSDLRVERKGVDAYTMKNYLNVIINTNDLSKHLLRVSAQSRRYFILECNSAVNQDKDHFTDLVNWLGYDNPKGEEVGVRSFADYLYSVDLTDFDARKIPITEALITQKMTSLSDIHSWWFDCLNSTSFMGSPEAEKGVVNTLWEENELVCGKMVIYQCYERWAKDKKRHINYVSEFWKQMKQVLHHTESRDEVTGKIMVKIPTLHDCRLKWMSIHHGMFFLDTPGTSSRITHHLKQTVFTLSQAPDIPLQREVREARSPDMDDLVSMRDVTPTQQLPPG